MSAPSRIHPTAVVDPSAALGAGVEIGPYSVIGAEVSIGAGTRIGPHCTVLGPTRIGCDNHFHGHAAIGGEPQDKKYRGERVELEIGDDNVVREFVTINRGTGDGGGLTRIGHRNWILAYSHIAHDCRVGSDCVFSNNATLAGHVTIGDFVILSGFAGVHQFCRIGDHAFIDSFDFHRRFVGLDLSDDLARLDLVPSFDVPLREVAFLHRRRQRGHGDLGRHYEAAFFDWSWTLTTSGFQRCMKVM